MPNETKSRIPDDAPEAELCKGTAILTHEVWALVQRDAEVENRSESYILRSILGRYYGLPVELYNPKKRRTRKPEEKP